MRTNKYRGHDEPEETVAGTLLNSLHPGLHTNPHRTLPSAQQEERTYAHLWFKAHKCLLCRERERAMDSQLSADFTLGTNPRPRDAAWRGYKKHLSSLPAHYGISCHKHFGDLMHLHAELQIYALFLMAAKEGTIQTASVVYFRSVWASGK